MTYKIVEKTIKGKRVAELKLKFIEWADGFVFCMIEMEDGKWYRFGTIQLLYPRSKYYDYLSIEEYLEEMNEGDIEDFEEMVKYYMRKEEPEIMKKIVNPSEYGYGDFKYK